MFSKRKLIFIVVSGLVLMFAYGVISLYGSLRHASNPVAHQTTTPISGQKI